MKKLKTFKVRISEEDLDKLKSVSINRKIPLAELIRSSISPLLSK